MAKRNEEAPEPSVIEQLDALLPVLEANTAPGVHPDVVRLALMTVIGGIGHVHSALDQVRVSKLSEKNTQARAEAQAAQERREEAKRK